MNRLLKLPVIAAVLLTAASCSVNRRQAEKARELFSHGMEMVEIRARRWKGTERP